MNKFDIVFLVVIAALGLRGLWRGLIREAAMMGGVFGGLILARLFHGALAPMFEPRLKSEWAANAAGFAVIFVAAYIAGIVVSLMLGGVVRRVGAGGFERFMGMMFGAFEGVAIVGVFLLVVRGAVGTMEGSFLRDSAVAPYVMTIMDFLTGLLQRPGGMA